MSRYDEPIDPQFATVVAVGKKGPNGWIWVAVGDTSDAAWQAAVSKSGAASRLDLEQRGFYSRRLVLMPVQAADQASAA